VAWKAPFLAIDTLCQDDVITQRTDYCKIGKPAEIAIGGPELAHACCDGVRRCARRECVRLSLGQLSRANAAR
jgi:hypothetical protein